MTADKPAPLPLTHELLDRISPKQRFPLFDTIDWIALIAGSIFWVSATVFQALGNSGSLDKPLASTLAVGFLVLFLATFAIWCVIQGLWVAKAFREGLRPAAQRIQARLEREERLIDELRQFDGSSLKARGKHLEIEAKHITRRAGALALLVALGVAGANLLDLGEKNQLWGAMTWAKVLVSAGSISALIASLINAVLAGRLERLGGLLALAADPKE